MMKYKYYLTERPIGPGTVPKGFVELKNFDTKTTVQENVKAYGYVCYDHELQEREIVAYELTKAEIE